MNFESREEMIKYIENFRLNYKTELCKNWMHNHNCEFEGDCAYAHGYEEVNVRPSLHKNYKTKMCKKWHETTPG
jgi:butyrate response factor 1